jgi:hypothetical protein
MCACRERSMLMYRYYCTVQLHPLFCMAYRTLWWKSSVHPMYIPCTSNVNLMYTNVHNVTGNLHWSWCKCTSFSRWMYVFLIQVKMEMYIKHDGNVHYIQQLIHTDVHQVYTACTSSLHWMYTMFTLNLHCVYSTFHVHHAYNTESKFTVLVLYTLVDVHGCTGTVIEL